MSIRFSSEGPESVKITTTTLSKEYGVNTSTISTILSSKAKILELYEKNLCGPEKNELNCQVKMTSINQCCFGSNKFKNTLLVEDYSGSWSENTAKVSVASTPVGAFFSIIRIAFECTVLICLYLVLSSLRSEMRTGFKDKCQDKQKYFQKYNFTIFIVKKITTLSSSQ
ncbi:hypothetical protein BpHYR1_035504 [Brachionus plicatilis]|uniref:HTH psq-type domain-containing protein n=1 Tax=Brachionus plicatilis TaxID=10195 RepID=A0A3M7SQ30_BRAPC|nr:hypothetical protein BpHYR1_035504 [Brachionus plicatilis]